MTYLPWPDYEWSQKTQSFVAEMLLIHGPAAHRDAEGRPRCRCTLLAAICGVNEALRNVGLLPAVNAVPTAAPWTGDPA